VPGSDLADRSLGVGDPNSASKASGKHKATWSSVDLTGGGAVAGTVVEYDILHDLGEIPTVCTLAKLENAAVPGTFIEANAVRVENWSHSHCHMSLRLVAGSFDGCRASFRVQGK
jgi:hypothetical protein